MASSRAVASALACERLAWISLTAASRPAPASVTLLRPAARCAMPSVAADASERSTVSAATSSARRFSLPDAVESSVASAFFVSASPDSALTRRSAIAASLALFVPSIKEMPRVMDSIEVELLAPGGEGGGARRGAGGVRRPCAVRRPAGRGPTHSASSAQPGAP